MELGFECLRFEGECEWRMANGGDWGTLHLALCFLAPRAARIESIERNSNIAIVMVNVNGKCRCTMHDALTLT